MSERYPSRYLPKNHRFKSETWGVQRIKTVYKKNVHKMKHGVNKHGYTTCVQSYLYVEKMNLKISSLLSTLLFCSDKIVEIKISRQSWIFAKSEALRNCATEHNQQRFKIHRFHIFTSYLISFYLSPHPTKKNVFSWPYYLIVASPSPVSQRQGAETVHVWTSSLGTGLRGTIYKQSPPVTPFRKEWGQVYF